jgi:hypothetical protein
MGFTTDLGASVLAFNEEESKTLSMNLYNKVGNTENSELKLKAGASEEKSPELISEEKPDSDQKESIYLNCTNQLRIQGRF